MRVFCGFIGFFFSLTGCITRVGVDGVTSTNGTLVPFYASTTVHPSPSGAAATQDPLPGIERPSSFSPCSPYPCYGYYGGYGGIAPGMYQSVVPSAPSMGEPAVKPVPPPVPPVPSERAPIPQTPF